MSKIQGTWRLQSSDEKWDDYMKVMGVNFALRQVGKRISATEELSQDGDVWTLSIKSTFKNALLKFKLGEEFDEDTMDGRRVKSVFNVEGDSLVHYQKSTAVGIPDSVIRRDRVDENTMTITLEAIGKNVKTVRTFNKVLTGQASDFK